MKRNGKKGFTLIELLTVIAIIAILASILIPTVGAVQQSVRKSKTKAQFNGYAVAYESFKAEYGYYPKMDESSNVFNLEGNNAVFIQTLSGRKQDGGPAINDYAKRANKRRINFYSFSESELGAEDGPYPGEIVDAFDNRKIVIVVDGDRNGVIPAGDLATSSTDINAGVAIYVEADAANDWEEVNSWD